MHTPAPWLLSDARSTKVDLINSAKGHAIGEIVWVDVRNPADAKLIAAAPELLEALQLCEGNISSLLASAHPKVYGMWLDVVRAAIDKAIGEKA
jgi:hypothetical protein